ncbi:MAG: hypothetical protein IIC04_11385 [Proteobacteria bacterium]|nr:hypothetical protein [Pseudomonadota bacterium]
MLAACRAAEPNFDVYHLGPGVNFTAGDRLREDTGFTLGHTLEAGIRAYAEWMRAHPETYR